MTGNEIENEFKIMLTKEQYEKIVGAFSWDKTILQTNNYYDTEDLRLSHRRITVRVREVDEDFLLQLKLPTGKVFSRVELTKKLIRLPELIHGELLSEMTGEPMPDVKRMGKLFTKRLVKRFKGGEIDLDMSEYFDIRDFEAEVEFTDENAGREILEKLRELIGDTSDSVVCKGKITRFTEEYKKRRGIE